MNKTNMKLSTAKIGKYLRELSIVIIGVAVTLYAGSIIGNIKEKQDLNLQLNAIAVELEFNLKVLDQLISYYEKHNRLNTLLNEHIIDNPQLVNDSINSPKSGLSQVLLFLYKRGAYDMFVNSGAMKLLSDKKIILEITESYIFLEATKEGNRSYMDTKKQELSKQNSLDAKTYLGAIDVTNPLFYGITNFYLGTSGHDSDPKTAKKQIEKTLALLKMR